MNCKAHSKYHFECSECKQLKTIRFITRIGQLENLLGEWLNTNGTTHTADLRARTKEVLK